MNLNFWKMKINTSIYFILKEKKDEKKEEYFYTWLNKNKIPYIISFKENIDNLNYKFDFSIYDITNKNNNMIINILNDILDYVESNNKRQVLFILNEKYSLNRLINIINNVIYPKVNIRFDNYRLSHLSTISMFARFDKTILDIEEYEQYINWEYINKEVLCN